MPRIPTRTKPDKQRQFLQEQEAALADFAAPDNWTDSNNRANSIWRDIEDARLSIFLQSNGYWSWCIARAGGHRTYASTGFEDIGDACFNLARELGVIA